MKTINIIDNGCERYTIKADCTCLGRQWDNEAEELQVVIPEREISNTCTMIVSASGEVIDHIDIKGEPKKITNVLSRHNGVEISFSFTNETGYVKNSEIKNFYFAEARKPEDFVPVEPEQTGKIDILLAEAFIRVEQDGKIIRFFNANGDLSQEIVLAEGVTDYKDLDGKPSINGVELVGNKTTEELGIVSKETDPTVPAWAKEPNKPSYVYDEIDERPTKLSEFDNDTQFVDNEYVEDNYLSLNGGTLRGLLYTDASTPYFIGKNKKVGMRAVDENNKVVGQFFVSDSEKETYNGYYSGFVAQGNDGKNYAIRISANGPVYRYNSADHPIALKEDITKEIANLVNSAPETLDTLGEVATAIQDNAGVVEALNSAIGTKQNSTDDGLNTTNKTIVGAINEINSKIGSANTQLENILGV